MRNSVGHSDQISAPANGYESGFSVSMRLRLGLPSLESRIGKLERPSPATIGYRPTIRKHYARAYWDRLPRFCLCKDSINDSDPSAKDLLLQKVGSKNVPPLRWWDYALLPVIIPTRFHARQGFTRSSASSTIVREVFASQAHCRSAW
jgi:hypothetical protein